MIWPASSPSSRWSHCAAQRELRGRYEANVRIEPLDAPCEVWLLLGDVSMVTDLAAGATEARFHEAPIEAGELGLGVLVRNKTVERGAYQIEMSRK